jgi:DNA-binding NarL/FixJ family response regulator
MTSNDRRYAAHLYRKLNKAAGLFCSAEYGRALDVLSGDDDIRSIIVRAKCLSRLGRPRDALEVVERYHATHEDVPLLCAIAVTAAAQIENFAVVEDWARRAGDVREIHASVRGEAASYMAMGYWAAGRRDLAERILPIAFAEGSPNGALRARILYGLLCGSNERYEEQVRILRFAASCAINEPTIEVGLLANVTQTLCGLSCEMPWIAKTADLQRLYDSVKWPEKTSSSRFQTTQALGWRYALDGDYATAYEWLRAAQSYAPTAAFSLFARIDLTIFARRAGEKFLATSYLRETLMLSQRLDLTKVSGEERDIFLSLAELIAKDDPPAAQQWIDEYDKSSARVDRLISSTHDRRLDAIANYTRGIVLLHSGRVSQAKVPLSAAYDVFQSIGYVRRAKQTARVLSEITNDRAWRLRANEEEHGSSRLTVLTPREHMVAGLIWQGMTIAQISTHLAISKSTVENHKNRVLSKLGVHSQRELILSLRAAKMNDFVHLHRA